MSPPQFDNTQFAEVTGSAVGDQPTATDSLGFGPYSRSPRRLSTFGVYRASANRLDRRRMGSGKSSFMMQLEVTDSRASNSEAATSEARANEGVRFVRTVIPISLRRRNAQHLAVLFLEGLKFTCHLSYGLILA